MGYLRGSCATDVRVKNLSWLSLKWQGEGLNFEVLGRLKIISRGMVIGKGHKVMKNSE